MHEDLVVGVDIAAARPCVAVALRCGRTAHVAGWFEMDCRDRGGLLAMADWIHAHAPSAIAIDAPQGVNLRLLQRGGGDLPPSRTRVCDLHLRRAGLPLYQVPVKAEAAAQLADHWMAIGRRLFATLKGRAYGYEAPAQAATPGLLGAPPAVIEVFPHASFVTLLGGVPPAKSTRAGAHARVMLLREMGVRWDEYYDHDSVDALACAVTAERFMRDKACGVGHEREGLVWLPVTAARFAEEQKYRRFTDGALEERLRSFAAARLPLL
jgi:predicted nuclease with RNAse H fold